MARILIGNIKGPQGIQGIQGPQGKQGIQGPAGPLPSLTNNALATKAGVSALDAVMGKTLQDQITTQNNNFETKVDRIGFNNIDANGIYYFGGDSAISNRPPNNDTGEWWGICHNMVYANGVYVQIAIDVDNNRYTRALNNGAWTAWKVF